MIPLAAIGVLACASTSLAQEEEAEPQKAPAKSPFLESLEIGGQIRVRYEYRKPATYDVSATDGRRSIDATVERTRLHLKGDVNNQVSVFLEIQDSRVWGTEEGGGPLSVMANTRNVDLHQGYFEIKDIGKWPLSLKVGRFAIPALGDQRLLSPLDWNNTGRAFDGMHALYEPEGWRLHCILATVGEPTFVDTGDADDDFAITTLYLENRQSENLELDAYLIYRDFSDDDFTSEVDPGQGEQKDFTLGVRAKYSGDGWFVKGEAAFQSGERHTDDIQAWAFVFRGGVDASSRFHLIAEVAMASGEDSNVDGDVNTFDPIYTFAHAYHGHADLVGWRNLQSLMIAGQYRAKKDWVLHLDIHHFRVADDGGSWFDAGGRALRNGVSGSETIGTEIDLYVKWTSWDAVKFWAGYTRFEPGDLVEDTGYDDATDWFFVQAAVDF